MIISTISAIHRAIVSFAIFIFLVGSSVFFLLKDGIVVDQITISGLEVEKLYIKWDEKLTILAQHAHVTQSNKKSSEPFDSRRIIGLVHGINLFQDFVGSVSINRLGLGDAEGTFHYNLDATNDLILTSPRYALHAVLDFTDEYFLLTLKEFTDTVKDVRLSGSAAVNLYGSEIYAETNVSVGEICGLHLYAEADPSNLVFSASADNTFADISPIVDIFDLPENISKWIVDYAEGTDVTLHTLYGAIPFQDHPAEVLHTLYAKATYNGLAYTFNRHVAPIVTERTEVVFENGVLNIYPKNARFYAHDAGSSWLNIDFNTHPITLHAFVRTDTILDDTMLKLLDSYKIRLPFKQLEGTMAANLDLDIVLATGATQARGRFTAAESRFRYKQLDLAVASADITLQNADVTIERLDLSYEKNAQARVHGFFNPVNNDGHLQIELDRLTLGAGDNAVTLSPEKPLHADYLLSRGGDSIVIEPSLWHFGLQDIRFEAMKVPFDFAKAVASLQNVAFDYGAMASGTINGRIDFMQGMADVDMNVRRIKSGPLTLAQKNLPISLKYDRQLRVQTSAESLWDLNGTSMTLSKARIDINASHATTADEISFEIDRQLAAVFGGTFEWATSTATVRLPRLTLSNNAMGTYFTARYPIDGLIHIHDGRLYAASDDLDLSFTADTHRWDLSFYSLEHLSEHSGWLRRYKLTDGHVQCARDYGFDLIGCTGSIDYPYAILVDGDGPVHRYDFTGQYKDAGSVFTVNNNLKINIGPSIDITSESLGYNLGGLLKIINTKGDDQLSHTPIPKLTLNAQNSFIYFTPERRAVADGISLYTNDNGLYARLNHDEGVAIFELVDGKFYLYGNRFGDRFMRHLLALADYRGGALSFHVNGTTSTANGVVRVKDTVIRDYRLLNNILAFINTVPSLATFSLPHYSDKGLEVSDAYASFVYDQGVVSVKGVKIDSPEIDIAGNGKIDYVNETIDLKMNLITDAGKNVSKIPIVGYILVGDKGDVMTTLKVTGNMNDPKVSTDIAKGIAVTPFKMILRTLSLPFSIFDKEKESAEESE